MELRRCYMSCCNQKHLICNFPETKKWTLIKCRIDLIKNRTEQIPTVVNYSQLVSLKKLCLQEDNFNASSSNIIPPLVMNIIHVVKIIKILYRSF